MLTIWLALLFSSTLAQKDPNCAPGRDSFVHLFEWKWTDVAAECERFLGPRGYCGVQVSPINEHRIVTGPWRPWWERYQPVSYKLTSRSGDENQFADMVRRCNDVGVRIYVDAVINHMTGGGSGTGSAGTSWNADSLDFPGVPFSSWDFNSCADCGTPSCNIESYQDVHQIRNCRLVSLRDLKLSKDYVRSSIANFMNKAIDYGVAGFRIDAAKHMWPGDMDNILGRLHNLNTEWFPSGTRPFIFQEVIDLGGEPVKATEYTYMGRITEFKYGMELGYVIRKQNGQKLRYLRTFGEGWAMLPTGDAVTFVDNHDNQRGHGAGGLSILTFHESSLYKRGVAFLLAWPYGFPRVMSSYYWNRNIQNGKDVNDWIGPPSDGKGHTKDVVVKDDNTCSNGWICEHRWRQIYNMVRFRNTAAGTGVANWWDNGNNQIAFSRGNKAFLVINNDNWRLSETLYTGLPAGSYCDVISGDKVNGRCTGKTIDVDGNGNAYFDINNTEEDPMVAIHVGL